MPLPSRESSRYLRGYLGSNPENAPAGGYETFFFFFAYISCSNCICIVWEEDQGPRILWNVVITFGQSPSFFSRGGTLLTVLLIVLPRTFI